MRNVVVIIVLLLAAGCAHRPTLASADGPIAPDVALVGETRHQRSVADFEWLLLGGVDKPWRFTPNGSIFPEKNRFHEVPAGRRTLYVRVWATASRGLMGARDGLVKFDQVELDGGRAYVINGTRDGDVFNVWIEDLATREHITSALAIRPPRHGAMGLFGR